MDMTDLNRQVPQDNEQNICNDPLVTNGHAKSHQDQEDKLISQLSKLKHRKPRKQKSNNKIKIKNFPKTLSDHNFSESTFEDSEKDHQKKLLRENLKQIYEEKNHLHQSRIIDSQYSSNYSQNSSSKRIYNKRNIEKVQRWTQEESELYEKFIEMYADIMCDSSSKRNTKIFLLMSNFIGTKTPCQCRSHHQKFFKKVIRQKFLNYNDFSYSSQKKPNKHLKKKSKIPQIQKSNDYTVIENAGNNPPNLITLKPETFQTPLQGTDQYQITNIIESNSQNLISLKNPTIERQSKQEKEQQFKYNNEHFLELQTNVNVQCYDQQQNGYEDIALHQIENLYENQLYHINEGENVHYDGYNNFHKQNFYETYEENDIHWNNHQSNDNFLYSRKQSLINSNFEF